MAMKVKKMNQFKLKLKTAKGKVTEVLNKIESAVILFEKYKTEKGLSQRLNAKAKEIQGQLTKLEKEYEEMDQAVSDLMNAIITTGDDEVKGTKKPQIEDLEEYMKKFIKRYEVFRNTKRNL